MNALVPIGCASTSSAMPETSVVPKVYRCNKTLDCNCTVCGKPATGTHYLAVSCNGCRSFFRRSIALGKKYFCKRAGFNQLECFQRHRCKLCRFTLCLAAGMHPEGVQTEEEFDGAVNGVVKEEELPDDLPEAVLIPQPPQVELRLDKLMRDLLVLEDAHDRLRISSYCPRLEGGITVDQFAAGPSKLGVHHGPMRSVPYEPSSIMLMPTEVVIGMKIGVDFSAFDYANKKLWMFQDIVYSMEYMKALPLYHLLDDSSKRILLASAVACTNLTTAYYSYCHHSDRTYFPDGGTMSWTDEMHAKAPGSTHFNTGIITAIRDVQLDPREYSLLKMILICNPLLDGISPHDVTLIQKEKERCTKTLLSYVLARRGVKEGPAIFARILSIIEVVTRLTAWEKSQHILMLAMGLWKDHIPFVESIFHSN